MKKLIFAFVILFCAISNIQAQYSTYYYQRATLFETLPTSQEDIIFLGNSITDGGEWCELLANPNAKNRGISGDITTGVFDRLEIITKGQPAKLFLLIGINDLARNISTDTITNNIHKIVAKVHAESPRTQIFVQSILPVSKHYGLFSGHTSKGAEIKQINANLNKTACSNNYTFIDLYSQFVDSETGEMNLKYSNDGLHLLGAGYQLWASIIENYL